MGGKLLKRLADSTVGKIAAGWRGTPAAIFATVTSGCRPRRAGRAAPALAKKRLTLKKSYF
jgi:hypothetical protein